MEIQIFGVKKDPATRKALRFFAERRIRTHFVDLNQRPASPGELRRFVERFGVAALVNRESRRFAELGLRAANLTDARWIAKLAEEPLLLTTPLVRWKHRLTLGDAESEWRAWVEEARRSG